MLHQSASQKTDLTAFLFWVQQLKLTRWTGHVVRMETDDPARKIFLSRLQDRSSRRRGRPKLRLQDGVEASVINAGITG